MDTEESRAVEGWSAFHCGAYGKERWRLLHEALHREVEHLCFLNPFVPETLLSELQCDYHLEGTTLPGAFRFEVPEDESLRHQRTTTSGDENCIFIEVPGIASPSRALVPADTGELRRLTPFFLIDATAVFVALAMKANENDTILDVYAAPGGKSLVLASIMFARGCQPDREQQRLHGKLVSNEVSKERAARMQQAMRDFLPAHLFEPGSERGPEVLFTSADPGTPSNSMERSGPFDKILLQAPCVCDRLLVRGGPVGEMGRWSAGKVSVSSQKQLKTLYNSLWLLKEGGMVLYCTTALSEKECDGVVEALMRRAPNIFVLEVMPLTEDIARMVPGIAAETTEWGTRLQPDRTPFGPLYFSRIRLIRRMQDSMQHLPGS